MIITFYCILESHVLPARILYVFVTTHVVSLKLFRLKAEGGQKSITAALG
jgi:hypothetical protein